MPFEVNNARLEHFQVCKGTPFENFLRELSTNGKPAFWALDQWEASILARFSVLAKSGVYQSNANVPIDCQLNANGLPKECQLTSNWMPIEYQLNVNWLLIECKFTTNQIPFDFQWNVNWLPLVLGHLISQVFDEPIDCQWQFQYQFATNALYIWDKQIKYQCSANTVPIWFVWFMAPCLYTTASSTIWLIGRLPYIRHATD